LRTWDALLDASILFSFDRSGWRRHARQFAPADLDVDLAGRVCLVTGANSGIGFACARGLAQRGATVWLLCRDEARGRAAEEALRKETGNPRVYTARLDVSDLAAVRVFCASFPESRVDALVHNAGLLPAARRLSPDGLELCFATHVAGPLRLTLGLEPRLRAAAGRVVFVTSGGMYAQRLSVDDVGWERRRWDGVAAYAQTKRMQVVLTELLAARLSAARVAVNAMHPGWADTPGVRSSLPRFFRWMRGRLRTPEEGADTALWLAASEAAAGRSGRLFFDRAPVATHLVPWTREDAAERERFGRLCEQATGVRP
jgi:NAD(P)-dependent dehydrogenase (short-subunit alcohol dehydrogenase family)